MMDGESEGVFSRYYSALRNQFKARPFPQNLTWFITERCNLKCPYCFVNTPSHKKREEIPAEQALRFIRSSGLSYISFTGGEPMLYPAIEMLIKACLEQKIGVGISSNGYRNRELLASLKGNGRPIYIQVSLDGDREVHNSIRGSTGAFDDALQLIGSAIEQGHRVVIIFTVYSQNIASLKNVLGFCAKNRWPVYINFIRSSDQTRTSDGNSFIPAQKNDLTIEEMEYCYRLWREYAAGYMSRLDRLAMVSKTEQVINFARHGTWSYKCAAGINDAVMYPDGEIAVCETRRAIGNLQDYAMDWKRFWRGRNEKLKTCFCQWDCAMIYSLTRSITGMRFLLKYF